MKHGKFLGIGSTLGSQGVGFGQAAQLVGFEEKYCPYCQREEYIETRIMDRTQALEAENRELRLIIKNYKENRCHSCGVSTNLYPVGTTGKFSDHRGNIYEKIC